MQARIDLGKRQGFDLKAIDSISVDPNVLSPTTKKELTATVNINGENFDIASDWHFPLDEEGLCIKALAALKARKKSEVFICSGDIFDSGNGEDTSAWCSRFINALAEIYPAVLYVPGNHDLRGRENPWKSFDLSANVLMPEAKHPKVYKSGKNKILLGNLFYDLNFLAAGKVGLETQLLEDFYSATTDGKHLFSGNRSEFVKYTNILAEALSDEVSILVTHVLPHPCLVEFKTGEISDHVKAIQEELGITFTVYNDQDRINAEGKGMSLNEFINYWNCKSAFMGSNILEHPSASPRNNLACIYGHNHRGSESYYKKYRLLTHQPTF